MRSGCLLYSGVAVEAILLDAARDLARLVTRMLDECLRGKRNGGRNPVDGFSRKRRCLSETKRDRAELSLRDDMAIKSCQSC